MKKIKITIIFIIFSILISNCNRNLSVQTPTSESTNTPNSQTDALTTSIESSFISACDFIDQQKMETLFQESPLSVSEENGGCVIRNQWDTRSIWISVFGGNQALPAMQWHTRQLIAGWDEENLSVLVEQIINNADNNNLVNLQEARLPIYERLEFRWERVFTVGDSAYWILNSRAFKGILDVVSDEVYIQAGFSGFLAAQIQPEIEDLTSLIISQLPEEFFINFEFPEVANNLINEENLSNTPEIIDISKTSQEIYYGDLCGEETTTIRAQIDNFEVVDNVYLVYRLISSIETNDNWYTIFMNQITPSIWEITLSAETSFLTYELVNGARLEYSVAIIYSVDNVLRSQNFSDIVILQCRQ